MEEALRDSRNSRAAHRRDGETEEEAANAAAVGSNANSPSLNHNRSTGSRHRSKFLDSSPSRSFASRKTECRRDKLVNRSVFTSSRLRSKYGDSSSSKPSRYIGCPQDRLRNRIARFTLRLPFMITPDEETVVDAHSERT